MNQTTAPVEPKKPEARKFPLEATFSGGNNYNGPNEHFPYGGYRAAGTVDIIDHKPGTKHPYRVKPVRGTTVSGWVNEDTLKFKEEK